MVSQRVQDISATLTKLASPKVNPKQLLRAARKRHPKATKKEIVRAAFYALIVNADKDVDKAKQLQQFAITQRAGDAD